MTTPTLARRAAAVSASFVLALGACGIVASAAFADGTTPVAPVATASAEPTDAPEAGDPTYTLTNNGGGSFSLAITIPGTSIAVDYTVDPTGAVTGATTSTAGATVTVDGHDLTITLADGRAVKVELGDAGDAVKDISVDEKNSDNNNDKTQQGDNRDKVGDQGQQGTDSQDHQGDNQDPTGTATSAPEPKATDSSSGDNQHPGSTGDTGSSDSSSGSSDSSGGSSDSGN
jgi:hypothetical protein